MPARHANPATPRYTPKKRRRGNPLTTEYEYEDDETEFVNAVTKFQKKTGRKFPSYAELLGVLKSLGYKKEKV